MLIRVNDWSTPERKREYAQFWADILPVIVYTVEDSFFNRGMKNPTQAEVKHRTEVAKELVGAMRFEFGWSRQRIRDNLKIALDAKIAGLAVDLDVLGKRNTW
jgi:hypothetical protein